MPTSVTTLKLLASLVFAGSFLLAAETAEAFRCGNKIVRDGMHEIEVIAACGEPTTQRTLGYAVRSYDLRSRRVLRDGELVYHPGYGFVSEEVLVTEYVYNFGPRRLMRRIVFEGGYVARIETLGYGFLEKEN